VGSPINWVGVCASPLSRAITRRETDRVVSVAPSVAPCPLPARRAGAPRWHPVCCPLRTAHEAAWKRVPVQAGIARAGTARLMEAGTLRNRQLDNRLLRLGDQVVAVHEQRCEPARSIPISVSRGGSRLRVICAGSPISAARRPAVSHRYLSPEARRTVFIPPRGARLITRCHCVPAVTRSGRGWETPGSRTGSRWRSFPVSTRRSR
jgi:hypothetical protein